MSRFNRMLKSQTSEELETLETFQESQESKTPKKLAKNQDTENYKRTTVYLQKNVLRDIKIAAAIAEEDSSDLINRAMRQWLDENNAIEAS